MQAASVAWEGTREKDKSQLRSFEGGNGPILLRKQRRDRGEQNVNVCELSASASPSGTGYWASSNADLTLTVTRCSRSTEKVRRRQYLLAQFARCCCYRAAACLKSFGHLTRWSSYCPSVFGARKTNPCSRRLAWQTRSKRALRRPRQKWARCGTACALPFAPRCRLTRACLRKKVCSFRLAFEAAPTHSLPWLCVRAQSPMRALITAMAQTAQVTNVAEQQRTEKLLLTRLSELTGEHYLKEVTTLAHHSAGAQPCPSDASTRGVAIHANPPTHAASASSKHARTHPPHTHLLTRTRTRTCLCAHPHPHACSHTHIRTRTHAHAKPHPHPHSHSATSRCCLFYCGCAVKRTNCHSRPQLRVWRWHADQTQPSSARAQRLVPGSGRPCGW